MLADEPLMTVAVTVTVPVVGTVRMLVLVRVAPVFSALDTLQTMAWLVALPGATVPVSVSGKVAVAVVGTPVMLVTGTKVAVCVEKRSASLAGEAKCVGVSA